jgi:DNA-binding MarR family transcriptional regulator
MTSAAPDPDTPRDPKGEFPFAVPGYLFHLVLAIARYREGALEPKLKQLGMTVATARALNAISRLEPCAMGELAEFCVTDRTTMTRTVDRLVELGWVERFKPANDRRQMVLNLTDAGREILTAARSLYQDQSREDLGGIPEEDLRAFVRTAQAIVANLAPDSFGRELVLAFRRPEAERDQ